MRTIEPTLSFDEALKPKASRIKAAIFDVDGVLTDATLYISEAGETLKAFNALDGHGLKLLAQGGIKPIVITGRDSPAVRRRLKDLGVTHAVFGAHDKLAAAGPLLAELGVAWHELAVMGDDWPDLPLLVRAGLALAPANAHAEVKAVSDYTSGLRGGQGFARECCDLMLWATGAYGRLLHGHLETLDTNVHGGPKEGRA
ncbi:KdsC family phosphatase [Aquabacterium sp.]|uniref:KdsC family phosphatase n=1 Tax=Aquabacterium sp. TaxID=1872578 RepID=UPI002E2ECDBF|nr:HAD hydrolase family protein [Aquabacterium sp.]HEX5311138.1 HAD hydrolase family protein [Aquabacterium sp.]